jgi:hypothetical protein
MNYQGILRSQASEFLDITLYLRGSKLELVGVGFGEAF